MRAHHKTSRQIILLALTSSAVIAAGPALAHPDAPEITYEERAVVQSLPSAPQAGPALISQPPVQEVEHEIERHEMHHPHHGDHALAPMDAPADHRMTAGAMYPGHAVGAPIYFPQAGYPAGAMPYPAEYQQNQLGRDEWLQECRARYDGQNGRGKKRGRTIGGLLGAAAGGLIGNRVAGRGKRLGGTLIGTGLGGLAGAVAGSAIGESSDRRDTLDECEAYLAQYEGQYNTQWQHMNYGYGPVMLVPIMVPVEQRAVVREYVTEEWVEEEVKVKVPGKKITRPAPKPVKAVPIKTAPIKTKSVKSIKGS